MFARKFKRGFSDPLSLAALGFLVVSLIVITATTANPLKKQLVNSWARYNPDALIRQRERTGECQGKYCLAPEVAKKAEKGKKLTPEEQEIIDLFQKAALGDQASLNSLKNKNINLYNQAIKIAETLRATPTPPPSKSPSAVAQTDEFNKCLQSGDSPSECQGIENRGRRAAISGNSPSPTPQPYSPLTEASTFKPNNSSCSTNAECRSGNCQLFPGGTKRCVPAGFSAEAAFKLPEPTQKPSPLPQTGGGQQVAVGGLLNSIGLINKLSEGQPSYNFASCDRPGLTPEQVKNCNESMSVLYNAPLLGSYLQAYTPQKVSALWQQQGYASLADCQKAKGPLAYLCNTYLPTKEQASTSISLGSTITGAGAAALALPAAAGAAGTAAAGGASFLGASQAAGASLLTSIGAISTMQQTFNAVNAQIMEPGSEKALQQTGLAALSWLNLGTADYLLKTFSSSTSTALQITQARNLNTIVSLINLGVDIPNAISTCKESPDLLNCGGATLAVATDIGFGLLDYKQGQLSFGNPLNRLTPPKIDVPDPHGTRIATAEELANLALLEPKTPAQRFRRIVGNSVLTHPAPVVLSQIGLETTTNMLFAPEVNPPSLIQAAKELTSDQTNNLIGQLTAVKNWAGWRTSNIPKVEKPKTKLSLWLNKGSRIISGVGLGGTAITSVWSKIKNNNVIDAIDNWLANQSSKKAKVSDTQTAELGNNQPIQLFQKNIGETSSQTQQMSPEKSNQIKNFSVFMQRENHTIINKGGDTMANKGCGPATAFNILKLTGRDPNLQEILDNFYWNCKKGCATSADAVLFALEQNGFENAYEVGLEHKITNALDLKDFSGILVYGGTVSSLNEDIAHIAGFSCDKGNCFSIDSYFSDGKPLPCEIKDSNTIQCDNYKYHVGPTEGVPDALYPVAVNNQ